MENSLEYKYKIWSELSGQFYTLQTEVMCVCVCVCVCVYDTEIVFTSMPTGNLGNSASAVFHGPFPISSSPAFMII
jgi:hypothetical protein